MKTILAICAFSGLLATAHAQLSYVDWTSASGNNVYGTITLSDSSVISVQFTGPTAFVQLNGSGTDYWLPNAPYDVLSNQPPSNDLIALSSANSSFSLTFSAPVSGLDFLSVSLGQPGDPVTYTFDHNFTVLDSGAGYWGGSNYTQPTSDSIVGREFSGTLGFSDAEITSLNWTTDNAEYWHGFTVAVSSTPIPSNPGAVPEPATYALFGSLGLLGLAGARRFRRA